MHARLTKLSCLLTVAVLGLTACADSPGPAGPSVAPNDETLTAVAGQGLRAAQFARAWPDMLSLAGAVYADHDEANDRLVFGFERGAEGPARQALATLGIPTSAYVIRAADPIYQVATLRDRWRPTWGGIQIHFGNFLCTLGFNADDGAQRSFITNSHCTNTQGGVEGTQYRQPTSTIDPTVIATEVEDPTYFRGRGVCPFLRRCRYSDASRALYSAGVASQRGVIAKTAAPNNGSIVVTDSFVVTSQDNATTHFALGTTVNKVGRTTGWTQGNVTATCVNTNVSGSLITQLCQTFVQNPGGAVVVGGGDSGSNVFRRTTGNNVQLVGILWGGNTNGTQFVFSPLKQIRDEIGPINAVR